MLPLHTTLALALCASVIFITGCQNKELDNYSDYSIQAEPLPSEEPPSRYGNQPNYTVNGQTFDVLPTTQGYSARGVASWYGKKFHGRPTSTMEPFDMYAISAAHPSLPIPTYVRVTNLENGTSIVVRVNDRGPFHADRIIDLSYGAAVKLGFANQGTAQVQVDALAPYQVRWQDGAHQFTNNTYNPPQAQSLPNNNLPNNNLPHGTAYQAAYEPGHPSQRYVYLQAGAYLQTNKAQNAMNKMQNWLDTQGIQVPVHLVFGDGYQKIHLGPLNNFSQAESLKQTLTASSWGKPIWIEVNPSR